ncbi:hypothetical protein [Vibrio splendidus]|uniref:hypothetical protein n=2 Tax=Vibrio TaxID=662 RepID=UPI0011B211A6|nr:hypothetical protein [Vibrio splendidus]
MGVMSHNVINQYKSLVWIIIMLRIKLGITLLSIPIALSLTGCGDSSNARFDSENQFWDKDVNYSKSRLFNVGDVKGTIFDEEALKYFSMLSSHHELNYPATTTDQLEKATSTFADIRTALNYLPVPETLKAEYEANLMAAEEILPKMVELHEGKFEGKLDEAFRSLYPEYFESVDAARLVVDNRNEFLTKAKTKKDELSEQHSTLKKELRELEKEHEKVASEWIVENELLIPTNDLSFRAFIDNSYYYDTEDKCREYIERNNENFNWNSEAGVCYSFWVMNDNLGLKKFHLENNMSEEQAQIYKDMAMKLFKQGSELGFKISTVGKSLHDATEELKKRELLSNNRFGDQRKIDRALTDANRGLNSRTKGAYGRNGEISIPAKGRYNPTQRRVFGEYAKTLGLDVMPTVTAFIPENAYKVYLELLKATEAAEVDIELGKKGQFNVGETEQLEHLYIVANTKKGNVIGSVQLQKNEDKFIASFSYPYSMNRVQGDSLVDLYAYQDDWNPTFNGIEGNKHRNLVSYIRSLNK